MGVAAKVYTYTDNENRPKRMMSYTAALFPADKEGLTWEYSDDEHNNVLEYFDIDDGNVRGSNNSRVISIDALSTDDFEAEFWYDDNKYGEDPIKLVFVNKNSSNN